MRTATMVIALVVPRLALAETTPLSQLSTKVRIEHDVRELEDLKLTFETDYPSSAGWATIAPPYCHLELWAAQWSSGDADLDDEHRGFPVELPHNAQGIADPFGVERLVIRGATAELERISIGGVHYGELAGPTERIHIPLHRVASIDDRHDVYAFRVGSHVFVVAPTGARASVRFDSEAPSGGRGVTRQQDCGYAITQLRLDHGSSQAVQILDAAYVVDASLSQTSRDPEPLLSVTIRAR